MTPEDMRALAGESAGAGQPNRGLDRRTGLLVVVALILVVWGMRAMAVVLVPLVSAILIALAVMPIRDAIRARVPGWLGWLGHVAAMLAIVFVLALFFGGIFVAARQIVAQMPDPGGQLAEMLQSNEAGGGTVDDGGSAEGTGSGLAAGAREGAAAAVEGSGDDSGESVRPGGEGSGGGGLRSLLPGGSPGEVLRSLGERAAGAATGVATAILNGVLGLVAGLVLIFFLTLLILLESGEWRRKLHEIARPMLQWQILDSAEVIASKVRRYLAIQAVLGLATAVLYGLWLWFWDVDLILVWSLLTLLLVFIPTVGSLIAGVLPVAYTLLTQDLATALGVGAGLLVIEQIMGNFAEPRFQGRNIALSPLVILGSLTFWVWVWGLAGALLAVPVTVALLVIGAHMPATRPWALLLSDQTDIEGLREVTRPE